MERVWSRGKTKEIIDEPGTSKGNSVQTGFSHTLGTKVNLQPTFRDQRTNDATVELRSWELCCFFWFSCWRRFCARVETKHKRFHRAGAVSGPRTTSSVVVVDALKRRVSTNRMCRSTSSRRRLLRGSSAARKFHHALLNFTGFYRVF